jgi:hypothetical protein
MRTYTHVGYRPTVGHVHRRCVGPQRDRDLGLRASVERTPLFSPRENAIAKEPGSS